MKKILNFKSIIYVMLVMLCMVFANVINAYAAEGDIYISNESGIRSEYNPDTKTLTLSASDSTYMKDFQIGDITPWSEYDIQKVVVLDGVTHIGDNAFSGCTNLQTVVMEGTSELSIGRRAFYRCIQLVSVKFSEGLAGIGAYAFDRCSSLSEIDLSGTAVTELGIYAFGECYSAESLKLSQTIKNIGDYCFSGCNRVTSVEFPESLTEIGICAFAGDTSLANADLVKCVNGLKLDLYAFVGCTSLEYVILPNCLESIADYCFSECSGLKYVTMLQKPSSGSMGQGLFFKGNQNGTYLYSYETVYDVYFPGENEKVIVARAYDFNEENVTINIDDKDIVYTGKEIKPVITVTDKGGGRVNPESYDIEYENNINAGTATVIITGKADYIGSITKTFVIGQAPCTLTVKAGGKTAAAEYMILLDSTKKTIQLSASTTGSEKIRYGSSNKKAAVIDDKGLITAKAYGNTTITISANNKVGSNYVKTYKTIRIKVRYKQVISLKNKKVVYNYKKGATTGLGAYAKGSAKLSYSSSNSKVISVSKYGTIKINGIGKTVITIKAADTGKYQPKVRKITYTVRPVIGKVTMAHNSKLLRVTIYNPTPNSKAVVKIYDSASKKKLYGTPKVVKVGASKKVIIDVKVSGYSRYYPVVYVVYNNIPSQIITNRAGEIRR